MPASARASRQNPWRVPAERWQFRCGDGNTHGPVLGRPSRIRHATNNSQTVRGPVLLSHRWSFPSRYSDRLSVRISDFLHRVRRSRRVIEVSRGRLSRWRSRAHFAGCQEALPATPAIALDTGAGIGALGTVAVDLGLFEDHRENRCRAVRGHRHCMERGEPLLDASARDVGNRPAPEPGQDPVSVVVRTDLPCAGFPVPLAMPEELFGRHLERNRFGSISSRLITVPPRRQQGSHLRAGTLHR